MEALKPCPFCGSTATAQNFDIYYFIECNDPTFECCAQGPAAPSRIAATAAWNRRVLSPPAQEDGQ